MSLRISSFDHPKNSSMGPSHFHCESPIDDSHQAVLCELYVRSRPNLTLRGSEKRGTSQKSLLGAYEERAKFGFIPLKGIANFLQQPRFVMGQVTAQIDVVRVVIARQLC